MPAWGRPACIRFTRICCIDGAGLRCCHLLGHNDDCDFRSGAGGSVLHDGGGMSFDSLMTTYITAPGICIVGVARAIASPGPGPIAYVSGEPLAGDAYTLQISVEGMARVPEPGAGLLLALGLGTLAWRRCPLAG